MLATNLAAAGQAVAIVLLVEDAERTDAFFAAYSCYLPLVLWAASVRASLVPLIGPHDSDASLRRQVARITSAVASLGIALSIGLALAAPFAATALTGDVSDRAETTTRDSILMLAPAVALHFFAASIAAGLAAARRFGYSAAAYAVGGIFALLSTIVLLQSIGIIGAPVALLAGATAVAGAHLVYARRFGLRLGVRFNWTLSAPGRLIVVELLAAAALLIAQQVNLSVALAALAGDEGAITAYTLAFFLVSMLMNVSFSPLGLTLMPDLVARVATSEPRAAETQLLTVSKHAFLVLGPLLAGFLAFGEAILTATLGSVVAEREIELIYRVGAVFVAMAVPYGLFLMGGMLVVALRRWRQTLAIAGMSVVAHSAAVGVAWGRSPESVAVAHSIAVTVTASLLLAAIFGREWPLVTLRALRAGAPAVLLAAVIFSGARLAAGGGADASVAIAAGAAVAVYAVVIFAFSATFREDVKTLLRR